MSPTTRKPSQFKPSNEQEPESLLPEETYIVKVRGFPWWPVMILDSKQVTQSTKDTLKKRNRNFKGHYFHYYHTFEYGYEDFKQFRVFDPEKWKIELEKIDRIDYRAAIRQALDPKQFLSDRKAIIEREFAHEAGKMGKQEYEAKEVELTEKEKLREEYEEKILATAKDVREQEVKLTPRQASEGTHEEQRLSTDSQENHLHHEQQSSEIQMKQTSTPSSMSIPSNTSQDQEQEQLSQQSEVETEETNPQLSEILVQSTLTSSSVDINEERENEKVSEVNKIQPLQEQPHHKYQNNVTKSENIPIQQQKTGEPHSTSGTKREFDEHDETQKPQVKRKRRSINGDEPLIEIQVTQKPEEVPSLSDVAIVPKSPEHPVELTTYTMDRQLPDISQSVGESNIMQFDKTQINNDTVEPNEPITGAHENSTDPKPEIKSTTPMKIDDNKEKQVELAESTDNNGTTGNSSISQATQDPNFKRAIRIKYRLQTILSKHRNTKKWPVADNPLMKVAIQDIQKSQLSKVIVQTLHLGHWVSKASEYTFTMDKDTFDYKAELDNILIHWDLQPNK